ncbi:F-box/kelch-repeat protein At3g06240-like [Telopea speciosissima]|uniref:F-box/kelch-repeat protein At3g06240-like n=1 Tax=Telopea speciosissima TaxID=54955 RepID=UPI001CC4DD24|nr:F-box/kelch-repeat protein At3g06240-like [Telopea speciosissima]
MEKKESERISNEADIENIDPLLAMGDELATDILIRLPLKTLFRSKCVSIRWNCLISDSLFACMYVNRQEGGSRTHTTTPISFFCQLDHFAFDYEYLPPEDKRLHFLRLDNDAKDESDDNHVVMQHRVRSFEHNVFMVDSSNGLLLFAGTGNKLYFVSNLVSKQWVALPQPKSCYPYESAKLVRKYDDSYKPSLTQMKFEVLLFSRYENMSSLFLEIFSSETGNWRMVVLHNYPSYFRTLHCHTLFNGAAYWLDEHAGGAARIAALDFSHLKMASMPSHSVPHSDLAVMPEDCVQFIPLPASSDLPSNGFLGFSGGLLHYAESNLTNLHIWALSSGGLSQSSQVAWSLKQSVSLQFMIDEHPDIFHCIPNYEGEYDIRHKQHKFHFSPLAFHPSGLHLVLLSLPGMIVSYHIQKRKLEVVHHYNVQNFRHVPRFIVLSYNYPAWPTRLPPVRNDFPYSD